MVNRFRSALVTASAITGNGITINTGTHPTRPV